MFIKWDKLDEKLRNDAVRQYYEILSRKRFQLVFKRIFDILVSIVFLILFTPIILIISILIKRDSKGPIIYKQNRITQNNRVFKVWKFRTMVDGADKKGSHVTVNEDPRITKIGSKIRKYRIDEIPQLINILKGDMSFVGTRPEAIRYVEKYSDEMMATLLLPAGLTSETSVKFKDEDTLLEGKEDIDEAYINDVLPLKMKMNLESLRKFSFIDDIKIMFITFIEVLK